MPAAPQYRRVEYGRTIATHSSNSSTSQTTSYLERTAAVLSSSSVQPYVVNFSPLFSLVCEDSYVCSLDYCLVATRLMNHAATLNMDLSIVGTQYRPLNSSNTHTAGVFEII